MCHAAMIERELDKYKAKFGADAAAELWEIYFGRRDADPKHYKMERITYPRMYAPVVRVFKDALIVEPMRFGVFGKKSGMTAHVARRDNLTSSYWDDAFRVGHGFVLASRYVETAVAGDLIKGGMVSLDAVKQVLDADREARKAEVLAAGKKYKPTERELKDPREVSMEIEVWPEDGSDILFPVVFNTVDVEGGTDCGFAVITDPPTRELDTAGVERRPIMLDRAALDAWLRPQKKSVAQLNELLNANLLQRAVNYKLLPKRNR